MQLEGTAPALGGQWPDRVASAAAEVGREARSEQEEAMDVDTDEPGATATGGMEMGRPEARRGHVSAALAPWAPGAAAGRPGAFPPRCAGDDTQDSPMRLFLVSQPSPEHTDPSQGFGRERARDGAGGPWPGCAPGPGTSWRGRRRG